MLIIWGSKAIVQNLGSGVFYCPAEDSDQTYWHQRLRRWFTFFFIPLFPTGTVSEHVQCSSCGNAYYMSVLEGPTTADLSDALTTAVKAVAVAVAGTEEPVASAQEAAAIDYIRETVDGDYGATEFHTDAERLGPDVLRHTSAVAGMLSEHGKEQIVSAALYIAATDGGISENEIRVITEIAGSLGMAPNHLRGTIQAFVDAVSG